MQKYPTCPKCKTIIRFRNYSTLFWSWGKAKPFQCFACKESFSSYFLDNHWAFAFGFLVLLSLFLLILYILCALSIVKIDKTWGKTYFGLREIADLIKLLPFTFLLLYCRNWLLWKTLILKPKKK